MIWRRPAKLGGVAPEHNPSPTPSRAVYGFMLYLVSNLMLVMYLLWAILPDSILHSMGLDFFPQKYWAVAMPLYLSLAFLLMVVVVYPSLGRLHCRHPWDQYVPDSVELQQQQKQQQHIIYRKDLAEQPVGGVPPVHDMDPAPVGGVPPVHDMDPAPVGGVPPVHDMHPAEIQQYLANKHK